MLKRTGCIILVLLLCPFSDQHGFSPMHYACMHGHPKIVDMFLLRGARTDIVNMGGDSLLHMAAQYGKYDILIKVGRIARGYPCLITTN